MTVPPLQIVLVEPEIPQNAGNIGRTCIGLGLPLHFVGKLGFNFDDTHLKRAGLDYWPKLTYHVHKTWDDFLSTLPDAADLAFFSTKGKKSFWDHHFKKPCYLIFGSESKGLPKDFYTRYADRLLRIPVNDQIRSLNLSASAAVAAFEVVRQWQGGGGN